MDFRPSAGHLVKHPLVRPVRLGTDRRCAVSRHHRRWDVGRLLTRNRLIVPQDPESDCTKHRGIARAMATPGIAVDVVMQLCDVPVMLILFLLLSPVNKNVALLALHFSLVQTAIS